MLNGEKWYYDSSTDPNLRLEPSLLPSGKLVYAPIRFTYIDDWQESCVLTLKNGDQIRTEEVLWVRARSLEGNGYDPQDGVDYQYWMNEQNVGYVSVRSFDPFSEERNKLDQFVETGKSLRKADVIVYDVRSNSGGGDGFPSGWYENFAGTYPQYPFAGIGKNDYVHQEGLRLISAEKGKYIENDIPILVLADYRCASAGESALGYMRTLNNSIRIGTNSAGCELCGNTEEYQLPYTRITLTFGRSLDFDWDGKNIDGIGYEPDIWCDGAMAYEATMNMIEYYGISKESLAEAAGKVE